jgi:hypothetical protein
MIRLSCAAALLALVSVSATAEARTEQSTQVVYANTSYVEDIVLAASESNSLVYAATRGGVEAYDLASKKRVAHYTTADGLPSLHVRKMAVEGSVVVAFTREQRCELVDQRFVCTATPAMANAPFTLAGRMGEARITETLSHGGATFVATAGAGLWLGGSKPRRLTPGDQICSNHMMAITSFAGRTYFGSFDEGLCSTKDGQHFTRHEGDFRMINDLEATSEGLFVAASEGLFRSLDGSHFEKVETVKQRGVNGLAFDGRSLWVTTPGALWRVRVKGGPSHREFWLPGGARSLQAVAVRKGQVWIASEDRGLIKMVGTSFQVFDRAAGMPASWMLDVAIAKDGTAYGASLRDGIVSISKKGKITSLAGAPDAWTLFVDVDKHGIAMGTQGGAALVKDGEVSTMLSLPHPNVHVMARVGPDLFVGTEGGTVALHN